MSLSDEAVTKICECIKESDLFSACHLGQLRTTYTRNQTFAKMFKYTEPQEVALGMDVNMRKKNCLLHTSGRNSEELFTVTFTEEYTVTTVLRS